MSRIFKGSSNSHIDVGDITNARFETARTWTIMAFFNVTSVSDEGCIVAKYEGSSTQFFIQVEKPSVPTYVKIWVNNGVAIQGGNIVELDTWYLAVVMCDGTQSSTSGHYYLFDMGGSLLEDDSGEFDSDDSILTAPLTFGGRPNADQFDGPLGPSIYLHGVSTYQHMTEYLRNPYVAFERFKAVYGVEYFFPMLGGQDSPELDLSPNGHIGTTTDAQLWAPDPPSVQPYPPLRRSFFFDVGGAPETPVVAEVENIAVSDANPVVSLFQAVYPITKSDAVNVGEVVALLLDTLFADVSEAITVTDTPTLLLPDLYVSASEAVDVTDTPSMLLPQLYVSVSEAVTVGEAVTLLLDTLFIDLADAINVADVVVDIEFPGGFPGFTKLEALTVGEVVTLLLDTLFIDLSDAVNVGESATPELVTSLNIDQSEGVVVGEVSTLYPTTLYPTATEDIVVGEDIEALITKLQIIANESVAVGDTVESLIPVLMPAVSEQVLVNDVGSAERFSEAFVAIDMAGPELVAVGESVRVSTGGGRVNDDIAAFRQRYRILGDRRYQDRRRIKP